MWVKDSQPARKLVRKTFNALTGDHVTALDCHWITDRSVLLASTGVPPTGWNAKSAERKRPDDSRSRLPDVCSQRIRRGGEHRRTDLLFLQRQLRKSLSETIIRLAPRIFIRAELFFLIEFQRDLALVRRKVKQRQGGLASGDAKVRPGLAAEKTR